MSVVIATRDRYETIRKTIEHIGVQNIAGELELIVVGPHDLRVEAEDLADFREHQVIALDDVSTIAGANAEGVRRARSPIVVFAEDHCFPDPGWAAALVARHAESWVAVGPMVRNANPDTVTSRCDFVIGYGPWMEPTPAGPKPFLPGHNTSYKRDVLVALGDELEPLLEAETVLHGELRRRGGELYLEPSARVAHVNFSRIASWLPVMFHGGRVFAATRRHSWGLGRRLFYGLASPLIPAVRLLRATRQIVERQGIGTALGLVAPLATAFLCDGFGQLMGYLRGPGASVQRLAHYEFRRIDHVTPRDRRAVFEPARS